MKTTVISYSLTGNNEDLARSLAGRLAAEHVSIREPGRRTMAGIALDVALNRTPKVDVPAIEPEVIDLAIFVGPVWMGQVASPFRACLRELGPRLRRYAFVTVCGGADGTNPKLAAELTRRTGKTPAAVVELLKAGLLPPEPKPTRDDTMAYRINEKELAQLTETAMSVLGRAVGK